MATKTVDALAAKQAKQKKILIVGGVLLLGLAGIQGPKLLKQVQGTSASPAAATDTAATDAAATDPAADPTSTLNPAAAAAVGAVAVPSGPRPTATLVGVPVQGAAQPAVGDGQLRGFSLFRPKDPFVQQVDPDAAAAAAAEPAAQPEEKPAASEAAKPAEGAKPADPAPADGAPADAADAADAAGAVSEAAPVAPEPDPLYATLILNGAQVPLEVEGTFPEGDPLFVLVSLKQKVAEIGIVGGKLKKGKTVKLTLGKQITLVNTSTGARYQLKLVYTGSTPEEIKTFSGDEELPSAIPDAKAVPDAVTAETSTAAP